MNIQNNGLHLELNDSIGLVVEGTALTPDVRTISQMRPVLAENVDLPDSTGTYFMYREACAPNDQVGYTSKSLRYDITVVPALMLDLEFNKTLGHYHPNSVNPPLSYPELYEVLQGTAHYLLQKRRPGSLAVERCFLVECRIGEKAIMPPDYGHITVNQGDGVLVMDNIVERTFKSVYAPYVENHGGVYYVTKDGEKKNPMFREPPELEHVRAPEFNRMVNKDIAEHLESDYSYALFQKNPDFFEWLVSSKAVELK
jgi:glucose-6-phosphate isomerase, archaeal